MHVCIFYYHCFKTIIYVSEIKAIQYFQTVNKIKNERNKNYSEEKTIDAFVVEEMTAVAQSVTV